MISLTCEACHGVMDVDEGREILTCPYCGSKKLIPISDDVKIERIKQESIIEQKKMEIEKDNKDTITALIVLGVLLAISLLIGLISSFFI